MPCSSQSFILAYYNDGGAELLRSIASTRWSQRRRGGRDNRRRSIRPRMEKFFTPFNYASMTFFALLVVGGVQALVLGLLHHKVLRRYL